MAKENPTEALQAENAELKAQLAAQQAAEKAIEEKVAVGLTREQAISTLKQQAETDAREAKREQELKAEAEKAEKAKKQ